MGDYQRGLNQSLHLPGPHPNNHWKRNQTGQMPKGPKTAPPQPSSETEAWRGKLSSANHIIT